MIHTFLRIFSQYFPRCLWTCKCFERRGWTEAEEEEGGGRVIWQLKVRHVLSQSPFLWAAADRERTFSHTTNALNKWIDKGYAKRGAPSLCCASLSGSLCPRPPRQLGPKDKQQLSGPLTNLILDESLSEKKEAVCTPHDCSLYHPKAKRYSGVSSQMNDNTAVDTNAQPLAHSFFWLQSFVFASTQQ